MMTLVVMALLVPLSWADYDRGTAVEAKDMVSEAITSFDDAGADPTFARINAGDPAFRDCDLYVFVVTEPGRSWLMLLTATASASMPRP
ncbi:MAG: hypothetical protein CMM46_14440 [Rhodospirillaceae bacterium]|nr:hypothetical protein [Rhodospirillaceae bacterium]|tara:strand:+ start:10970 stop:11236 length:267 start_codon:yes stop_codon:yes gene_type:complete